MKGFVSSTLATLAGATVLIGTQGASVVTASLTAAATTVSPKPTTLFPAQTVQLTNEVLAAVSSNVRNANISDVFHFADPYTDSTLSKKNPRSCKVMPGDVSWPKNLLWNTLDTLLGKRLIKTVPLAAYCYPEWPEYDADKCANITSQWAVSNLHMDDPVSIMLPRYEGRTCMAPGYNYTKTCELGSYPTYVVNASTNTGHDFNGKSSGKGALSIWTHWFKDKAFYPQYKAANGYSLGVSVVGGEAVTVGLGGGHTAGGGHSPLSSMYGMAADQVLAMEVILANGRFITASSTENSDIFWMLRGGGGSTIGVVTSLIVKALPRLPTTTVTFNFTINDAPNVDAFWKGIEAYFVNFEDFINAGTYGYYYVGASATEIGTDDAGSTDYYFRMHSVVAPNMTIAETKALLAPWYNVLDSLNITYTPCLRTPSHDAWAVASPKEYVGAAAVKTTSRLMPRSVFQDDTLRQRTYAAHKDAIEKGIIGLFVAGFHISGTGIAVAPPNDTSVLPALLAHVIVGIKWPNNATWETVRNASLAVTSWTNVLRDIAPESGAYMSEADLIEPNLQEAFYGANYPALYALKQKYDPTGLFFALTAVGAEDWEVRTTDPLPYSWNNNGRLCPVTS
ncbi:hypothetical protein G4B84_002348 [Aspergillus flavus NRRL3357]|nr:uncharacterized protein G4B84_002348 [Aspergillus flavus NRRL3357]KAJ1707273.1 hypothetical protein NYO67_10591 [Aspergillus flavus]QMW27059.1 hypothetical protein G4B84_002348 [Aspergillus flavus NRRL3357]